MRYLINVYRTTAYCACQEFKYLCALYVKYGMHVYAIFALLSPVILVILDLDINVAFSIIILILLFMPAINHHTEEKGETCEPLL